MAVSAAEYYEVRWRIAGSSEAWSTPKRVSPVDEIVVTELERDKSYDFEVRAVSNCGAKSLWVSGSHAVPSAPAGTLTFADLQAASDAAKTAADAAMTGLDTIDNDRILSVNEKPTVIRDVTVIRNEYPGLVAQAQSYGLTTELTEYTQSYDDLMTYLDALATPVAWDNLSGNTNLT